MMKIEVIKSLIVNKTKVAYRIIAHNIFNHFPDIRKMVEIGIINILFCRHQQNDRYTKTTQRGIKCKHT